MKPSDKPTAQRLDLRRVHQALAEAADAVSFDGPGNLAHGYAGMFREFHHKSAQEPLKPPLPPPRKVCIDAKRIHAALAHGCQCWQDGTSAAQDYALRHLPKHLAQAEQEDQLESILTDFNFLMQRCRFGLLEAILKDYGLRKGLVSQAAQQRLDIWEAFCREKAHILRRGNAEWPMHKILLQLAVEHADDSPLTQGAEQWLADNRCDWLWLRRVPRLPHVQKNPCLLVFEGHTDRVTGALELAGGRLLSWSRDKTLRVWDGGSGKCLLTLEGHTDAVDGALELADGRLLSWSDDKTLRVWDYNSGTCLQMLVGHTSEVKGALALADGRLLSWASDKTLWVWDSLTGACLRTLEGHTDGVLGALA